MGALAHYLESEGIATTQISLVREHTDALAPPRALWVPFMLGRPFGVPDDAGFQARVLRAALDLLVRPGPGPLLEDFPEDAPHDDLGEPPEGLACPVSFPEPHVAGGVPLAKAFIDEVEQLRAWHELSLSHRRRTNLGVAGAPMAQLAGFIAACLEGPAPQPFRPGLTLAEAMKLACDELRSYYEEARVMQPGRHSSADLLRWFWTQTAAGQVLLALRERAAAQKDDPAMQWLATLSLVPRAADLLLKERQAAKGL